MLVLRVLLVLLMARHAIASESENDRASLPRLITNCLCICKFEFMQLFKNVKEEDRHEMIMKVKAALDMRELIVPDLSECNTKNPATHHKDCACNACSRWSKIIETHSDKCRICIYGCEEIPLQQMMTDSTKLLADCNHPHI